MTIKKGNKINMKRAHDKIVPDTSVIIDGRITELIKEELKRETINAKSENLLELEIIIPNAVLSELENQANRGREVGFDGLEELSSLRKLAEDSKGRIDLSFYEIRNGTRSNIRNRATDAQGYKKADEIIRMAAEENKATLITSDRIQALVSGVRGISVRYIDPKIRKIAPEVFGLFDGETMSVHLKENTPIFAKKGSVSDLKLVRIGDKIDRDTLERYARDLVEYAHSDPRGYIELERRGATVIQLGEYRIVITRPPFSDALEITAVKPLVRTALSDYKLSKGLLERLEARAEGILVAGSPGHGKTTFAQALADFYLGKGKIIKTMEQPRDLQVPNEITQYGPLEGSMENTSDVLLLVRPDYTIFDEVRKTRDFRVFADMRLAGVGMVGVVHANKAIDAIQRLVGRVELGVIPHIIDTVLFIKAGNVKVVYELEMVVKVPYGMREADLARPVVLVRDFETKAPRYELYSYGEEVVVIPIKANAADGTIKTAHAADGIDISTTRRQIIIHTNRKHRNENVRVFAGKDHICTARANRAGNIKINKNTEAGYILQDAMQAGKKISVIR